MTTVPTTPGPFRRLTTWLFRTYGPEPAPILLTHRRVFVLPTRAGLAFAAVLMAMLLGAINYQLSLGFVLTFLLAGLGHSAILHTFRNLARLEIEPGCAPPVFCGEPAQFSVRLTNRRNDARYALHLRAGAAHAHVTEIPAQATAIAYLALPTARRGWQRLPRVTLETRYPLGLIRGWSYVHPDMQILVWPRPESEPPLLPLGHGERGGVNASRSGNDDFAGLRDYQRSDSPRHIAWKASAGDGALLTKHFSGVQAGDVALRWDDLPATMNVEARLARLAAWVCRAHDAALGWRLELPQIKIGPAQGPQHRDACLRALALFGQEDRAT